MASDIKTKKQILVVDDHPLVRKGLKELINSEDDMEVCGEASGASDALQMIMKAKPDLVLLDLTLKEGSGLELIKQVRSTQTTVKILVSSMHDESLFAERVLRAGAMGYVHKHEATELVVGAIRDVLKGKIYLSEGMADRMLHSLAGLHQDMGQPLIDLLSDRELEVFELIGQGKSTREIAEKFKLSVKTIETHRESIKRKLNLDTGTELVRRAVQWVLEQ